MKNQHFFIKFDTSIFPMCDPGAVKWIETAFGECVITTTDKWSFIVGMLSNLCWIVSSAPQIYQN